MKSRGPDIGRRRLLRAMAASGLFAGINAMVPAYARAIGAVIRPTEKTPGRVAMDLAIRHQTLDIAGGTGSGMTINNTIPGPLVELYEGHDALLRVTNHLHENSSIHWHGILLPFRLDGVPGVTFPGIQPGETFEVPFPVRQSGTYWYHSHSGLQEQIGVYGPIVIQPADPDPIAFDRDYVVMLSDWTFDDPDDIMANLKKVSDYYNFNKRTVGEFVEDVTRWGWNTTVSDRLAWGNMRMAPTDIADVTGYGYTYLMNGLHPAGNWTGLFQPGERVRLRFINGSAMSYFNVRVPGLPMTVVAADGQNVQPVETDEFQIGVAETYDVIVEPKQDQAYTVFAESMDRSGYTRGTLAPRMGMVAAVPELREPPMRSMIDMGMDMSDMNMAGMDMMSGGGHKGMAMSGGEHAGMDMSGGEHKGMGGMDMSGDGHAGMSMSGGGHSGMGGMNMGSASKAGPGHDAAMDSLMEGAGPVVARHGPDHHGAATTAVATVQRNRLGEPGTGLEDVDHRVLVYTDLKSRRPLSDKRPPVREIEVHLTGNMERYMWSFNGDKFSEVDGPIEFNYGERLRLTLVNDTMMEHPIHLHGMFMDLENGQGQYLPRKHTISVKPAERLSVLITADEPGRWAFHCHLLYHMEMGMFRVVRVSSA